MQPTPWVCAVSLGTWRRPRAVTRQAQGRAAMWTVCFPLVLSPEFLNFSPSPTPPRPPTQHRPRSATSPRVSSLLAAMNLVPASLLWPDALQPWSWAPGFSCQRPAAFGGTADLPLLTDLLSASHPISLAGSPPSPRGLSPCPFLIHTPSPSQASLALCSLLSGVVTGALVASAGGCPPASIPPRASLLPIV